MSHTIGIHRIRARRSVGALRWMGWAFRFLRLAAHVRRERDELAKLSDAQLADIGISRPAAEAESARDFLDVPYNRRARLYL